MAVTNCRRCGAIFNRIGRDICPKCVRAEDEAYKAIREYLRKNKDVFLSDLAEGTGVPEEWIVDMIRDGRLILRDHPNLFATCENCGEPIQSGRFCAKCSNKLNETFASAAQEMQQKAALEKQKRVGYFSRDVNHKQ